MEIEVIKTEEQYRKYLKRFQEVFLAEDDSPEGKEADLLALVVKDYEDRHYPIGDPDPIEAIKYHMEIKNISKKELGEILGFPSRVSEILNKKRKLTVEMIVRLHQRLHIPLESLVKSY